MYQVILYYNFQEISDPDAFCKKHKKYCKDLGLKGRIYISEEGINGTAGGTAEQIEAYKKYLCSIPGFEDTEFKQDESEYIPFAKLIVKVRDEIVALHVEDVDPERGGNYLSPAEWRRVMEGEEDYVMIDVRNNYESRIGHFKGALKPDLKNFYDFPKWLDEVQIPKDKKVLMYCTGGIRCEKFSVLMKESGWDDVNQLHGGILKYAKEEEGKHFKGKCFVFDDRLVVPVNPKDLEPIAHCEITGKPADTYINCANMECNKLFVCSEEGARKMEGCCSEECRESEYKRPFDPEHAFQPFRKWYNYFGEDFKERDLASQKS
ncbi:rhodanese-related sulfurtransferase [Balneola sp. MJW-20]|uniref:oxygen-dependent tRNA uridine(34) hydroxylase TrhO n=1 Tax=Gracilimonas aurantiaca TaxID=3234185 RepID=UPI00346512C7